MSLALQLMKFNVELNVIFLFGSLESFGLCYITSNIFDAISDIELNQLFYRMLQFAMFQHFRCWNCQNIKRHLNDILKPRISSTLISKKWRLTVNLIQTLNSTPLKLQFQQKQPVSMTHNQSSKFCIRTLSERRTLRRQAMAERR